MWPIWILNAVCIAWLAVIYFWIPQADALLNACILVPNMIGWTVWFYFKTRRR